MMKTKSKIEFVFRVINFVVLAILSIGLLSVTWGKNPRL
jgi:hypothetical protein